MRRPHVILSVARPARRWLPYGLVLCLAPAAIIDRDDGTLSAAVRDFARLVLLHVAGLAEKIAGLDA